MASSQGFTRSNTCLSPPIMNVSVPPSAPGVDPELMLEILNNSAARSGLIAFKAPFVFERNFETKFSVKWMHKDVGLALESGKDLNVPLPLTGVTQQMFQAAVSSGYGEEDFVASIKVLEAWAGVEVKRR